MHLRLSTFCAILAGSFKSISKKKQNNMPVLPTKSTAISDLVLACSCIWSLYSIYGGLPSIGLKSRDGGMASNNLGSVWFALTLAASTIGAFRFRKPNLYIAHIETSLIQIHFEMLIVKRQYFDRLAPIHDLLSWLVLVIGLPCLASQFYVNAGLPVLGNLHLLFMLPPILSWLGRDQ